MDFSKIYSMSCALARGEVRVDKRTKIDNPWALLRNEIPIKNPIEFQYAMGSRSMDLIEGTDGASKLLSDRVIQILKENKFTGLAIYPIKLFGKHGEEIKGYHGFSVTGRCGAIDNSKSKKILHPPYVPTAKPFDAWIGLYFDSETWDGSDIFMPEGRGHIFVTELVKNVLTKAKVTNIEFKHITELENMIMRIRNK